jgi:hypothetical protein
MVRVEQNQQPYFTVSSETRPTWSARSPYLYPPGTGWPSYIPGHWVPFRSLLRLAGLRWSWVLLAAESQSTSVSGYRASFWDPWPDCILLFFLRLTINFFLLLKAPSLTRKRVCSLQFNHSLVRLLTPNSPITILYRLIWDCSLFVASYDSQGLRWKYSDPPPHGDVFLPAYTQECGPNRNHSNTVFLWLCVTRDASLDCSYPCKLVSLEEFFQCLLSGNRLM